jgi:hypothetical protein
VTPSTQTVRDTLACQRDRFEIPAGVTYLNCANTSPHLRSVTHAGMTAVQRGASHPARSPASVWTGTRFIVEPTPSGEQTKVDFRRTGYDAGSRFLVSNREALKMCWGL